MAQITPIGQIDGADHQQVTLEANGLKATFLTWGARLAELWVPDRKGILADIVLGHDTPKDWETHGRYLGATCGRYANRIAGGRFTLDGRTVQLDQNEATKTLHGGTHGFDRKAWTIDSHSDSHVTFATTSPDGEMGFPGTLTARTTYRIDGPTLTIEMTATADAPTIVNLVNHACSMAKSAPSRTLPSTSARPAPSARGFPAPRPSTTTSASRLPPARVASAPA